MTKRVDQHSSHLEETDEVLMSRLQQGEVEALGVLYGRHCGLIEGLVRRYSIGLTDAEVEELTHDVFVVLQQRARDYREHGRLRGYLCAIAIRTAKGARRSAMVRRMLFDRFRREAVPRHQEDTTLLRHDVERALRQLPEKLTSVLLLHTIDGLSGDEIAAGLGIGVNAVWTRLHRARVALRRVLEADVSKDDAP